MSGRVKWGHAILFLGDTHTTPWNSRRRTDVYRDAVLKFHCCWGARGRLEEKKRRRRKHMSQEGGCTKCHQHNRNSAKFETHRIRGHGPEHQPQPTHPTHRHTHTHSPQVTVSSPANCKNTTERQLFYTRSHSHRPRKALNSLTHCGFLFASR